MKKWLLILVVATMVGVMLVSGCAAGVAPEDFAKVQSDLATAQNDLEAAQSEIEAAQSEIEAAQSEIEAAQSEIEALKIQVAILSAISAYDIWYDQYYAVGAYEFADSASFIKKFGTLIEAIGDSACETAWNNYVAADKNLSDVVKGLPEDSSTWTEEQNEQWLEAATIVYNALGEVGAALFDAIGKQ